MSTKPTKQVNLKRFPVDLYERLQKIADHHRRNVTQEILHALDRYVELMEKKVDSGVIYDVDTQQ